MTRRYLLTHRLIEPMHGIPSCALSAHLGE
jgi:hypothetical protein